VDVRVEEGVARLREGGELRGDDQQEQGGLEG
jgi:hypothetical protein